MPLELARKSQPSMTRPTSTSASALLAAMLSVCESNGCDDSVDWLDMVSPSTLLSFSRLRSPDGRRLRRLAKRCPASLLVRTIHAKGHASTTGLEHRPSVEAVPALHYGASPSNRGRF